MKIYQILIDSITTFVNGYNKVQIYFLLVVLLIYYNLQVYLCTDIIVVLAIYYRVVQYIIGWRSGVQYRICPGVIFGFLTVLLKFERTSVPAG